jgi:hypothetical protein
VLRGFDETDILPYGGTLIPLKLDSGVIVPLTYIPPFPIYPPETAWMRQPRTDIPGLVIKGRAAFLPADLDRRYARESLPDHADLLANMVRWAANDEIPLRVDGHGLFDCNLYTQPGRVIAHVANLTATAGMPIDDLVPSGPLKFQLRLPRDVRAHHVKFLVANTTGTPAISDDWATVNIPSVTGHEVLVFE